METVTITIKFTTLQLIGAALQEIPYKLAAPALQEIEAAVQAYSKSQGISVEEKAGL